jgi:hypothetical protein
MQVIGLAHRIRVPGGLSLAMMDSGTLEVTGRGIAAGLNMTTAGTTTGIGILTATGTTITTSGV